MKVFVVLISLLRTFKAVFPVLGNFSLSYCQKPPPIWGGRGAEKIFLGFFETFSRGNHQKPILPPIICKKPYKTGLHKRVSLRGPKLMIGFTSAILTSSKNYCCDATPVISEIFNLPSWPKH